MIRIGISGWRYAPWRGVFYPQGLPQRRELEYAARHFSTLEINGSFYSLHRPEYYEEWHDAACDIKSYTSGYTSRALDAGAARIRQWDAAGAEVYVCFDNDVKVRAPFDALVLMDKLGLRWEPAVPAQDGETPYRLRRAGERLRLRNKAYGPSVTRDNPAWQIGK